jgi:hypothetical protein
MISGNPGSIPGMISFVLFIFLVHLFLVSRELFPRNHKWPTIRLINARGSCALVWMGYSALEVLEQFFFVEDKEELMV